MNLNLATDLSVIDGLQSLTLLHVRSNVTDPITAALVRKVALREAQPSRGHVTAEDTVCSFPAAALSEPVQLGDEITTDDGTVYIVLVVHAAALTSRIDCMVRKLAVLPGIAATLRLQAAVWTKESSGAALAEWNDVATDLVGRVQPQQAIAWDQDSRRELRITHHVYLLAPVTLSRDHRFVDQDGHTYDVVGYSQPERIDVLAAIHTHSSH